MNKTIVPAIGLVILVVLILQLKSTPTAKLSIIPRPMKTIAGNGSFTLNSGTRILIPKGSTEINRIAIYLAQHLRPATGLSLPILYGSEADSLDNAIILTTKSTDKNLGPESYEIFVSKDTVVLSAPQPAGLFYGVQTIRQLLPEQIKSKKTVKDISTRIPSVTIYDKPRFQWRGFMLDSCRHMQSKDFIKRYIDLMAYHKLNRFHWHLTDDQGWRIEIKKYPKLTQIGAWRDSADGCTGGHWKNVCSAAPECIKPRLEKSSGKWAYTGDKTIIRKVLTEGRYGGFYTQDDIREIVAFARSRYITVVPEIELPGHAQAALAAYPEYSCMSGFSCTGKPFGPRLCAGQSEEIFCAGNDMTFEFLQNILSEVLELFPSRWIHIGGDECRKAHWAKCLICQARIKTEGLKDENELQSYFIKRIEKFLFVKNRQIIGWDEVLEGGLAPEAIVQSWRGMDGAIAAAKAGHNTIVSPTTHCYLNNLNEDLDVKKSYSFEPVPASLNREQQKYILGGEGNLWTEWVPQEKIDRQVFPRLTALAEVFWSPKKLRNWNDFSRRMKVQFRRYDILGVDYYKKTQKVPLTAN